MQPGEGPVEVQQDGYGSGAHDIRGGAEGNEFS